MLCYLRVSWELSKNLYQLSYLLSLFLGTSCVSLVPGLQAEVALGMRHKWNRIYIVLFTYWKTEPCMVWLAKCLLYGHENLNIDTPSLKKKSWVCWWHVSTTRMQEVRAAGAGRETGGSPELYSLTSWWVGGSVRDIATMHKWTTLRIQWVKSKCMKSGGKTILKRDENNGGREWRMDLIKTHYVHVWNSQTMKRKPR